VKARRVKGLSPEMPLADAAEHIVRTRLDELYSFDPSALDPAEVRALHDLRIAAKRLRYVLEVTVPCFGDYARTALRRTKALQDLVGEIHDCDVMLPRVLGELQRLRERDAEALLTLAGDAEDIDAELVFEAPNAPQYRGLEVLAAYIEAPASNTQPPNDPTRTSRRWPRRCAGATRPAPSLHNRLHLAVTPFSRR
jgi:hypothetical protein